MPSRLLDVPTVLTRRTRGDPSEIVSQQPRRAVVDRHEEIEVAVAVVVAIGGAAANGRLAECGPDRVADGFERARAEIPEEVRRLGIGHLALNGADIVSDVAVGRKDVEEPIEVGVEEERGEREAEERRLPDRRERGLVDEEAVALVRIERHHLVREVADDDARAAAAVVIAGIDRHAGPNNAGLVQAMPAINLTSLYVPSPLLRERRFGCVSFATTRSGWSSSL